GRGKTADVDTVAVTAALARAEGDAGYVLPQNITQQQGALLLDQLGGYDCFGLRGIAQGVGVFWRLRRVDLVLTQRVIHADLAELRLVLGRRVSAARVGRRGLRGHGIEARSESQVDGGRQQAA